MEVFMAMDVPSQIEDSTPVLQINLTIFKLLKKERNEVEDLNLLFDQIKKYQDQLNNDLLISFFAYLRNICVLIVIREPQNEDLNKFRFELFKDNLQRGLLHYEGQLDPSRVYSITEQAIRLGEFNWAYTFLEKYKAEFAMENETQDIYNTNLALYYFGIGQFQQCLDHIPPTSPILDYMLLGRRLELICMLELESELLSYKLDAFKMFLSRTSKKLLPESRRQRNLDFLNIFNQIFNCPPGDAKRAEKILNRVLENKEAADYPWLLSKAKRLAGKPD
ncbi:MAG: hypothetical protein R3A50_04145 [Saprospiraceae bacterium]